jgi:hypothetical protein
MGERVRWTVLVVLRKESELDLLEVEAVCRDSFSEVHRGCLLCANVACW